METKRKEGKQSRQVKQGRAAEDHTAQNAHIAVFLRWSPNTKMTRIKEQLNQNTRQEEKHKQPSGKRNHLKSGPVCLCPPPYDQIRSHTADVLQSCTGASRKPSWQCTDRRRSSNYEPPIRSAGMLRAGTHECSLPRWCEVRGPLQRWPRGCTAECPSAWALRCPMLRVGSRRWPPVCSGGSFCWWSDLYGWIFTTGGWW